MTFLLITLTVLGGASIFMGVRYRSTVEKVKIGGEITGRNRATRLEFDKIMLTLTTEQKATVTVKPVTSKGNPAVVDGPPGWTIGNPSIATLVVSPDGLSAEVFGSGVGSTFINVAADADLTAGVRQITGSLGVTVVAAEAAFLNLEAGSPV